MPILGETIATTGPVLNLNWSTLVQMETITSLEEVFRDTTGVGSRRPQPYDEDGPQLNNSNERSSERSSERSLRRCHFGSLSRNGHGYNANISIDSGMVQEVYICSNCYQCLELVRCSSCGVKCTTQAVVTRHNTRMCPRCARKIIWNYTFKPKPVFYGTAKNKLYYGIELELEAPDETPDDDQQTLEDYANRVDREYFYCKEDSSIDYGFEVVSHPASFNYMTKQQGLKQWQTVLDLSDSGMSSPGTCGMHVHMSKDAFSTLQMYKFMKFIYENSKFTLFMSERTSRRLRTWAAIDNPEDASIIYKAKRKEGGYERHVAVAITPYTIEVRIFAGTMNERKFYKNIEFCDALFYFADNAGVKQITVPNFIQYVYKNRRQYPNLFKVVKTYKLS